MNPPFSVLRGFSRKMCCWFVAMAPLCAATAQVTEPVPVAELVPVADDPRLTTVRTLDTKHLFEPPETLDEWNTRAESLRLRVRVAAGLEPEPLRTPLRFRSYEKIDRDTYTIENVSFESLPGFYVTGNLYRPRREPGVRVPAVLCPHGHWENGRLFERSIDDAKREVERGAEQTIEGAQYPLQARCAHLARMGCVVLIYDMVGYADNTQLGHGEGFGDPQAESLGLSAFGLQTWNSIRALDLLTELPEVDPTRIGVTGASGGATQTFVLTAIDERVKAAFPAVMVSPTMQGGCICENASHLRIGTDNVELAALAAPRPLAMTCANDWTRNFLDEGLPELKKVYALYGKEDAVAAWCYPQFDHNYNQVAREHMYAWFQRHLGLEEGAPTVEAPFQPVPPADLRVFDTANPRPLGADRSAIRYAMRATVEPKPFVGVFEVDDRRSLTDRMRARLRVLLDATEIDPNSIESESSALDPAHGMTRERLVLRQRGKQERVIATLCKPQNLSGRAIVIVCTDGPASTEELLAYVGGIGGIAPAWLIVEPLSEMNDRRSPLPMDTERHARYPGYTFAYNRTLQAEAVRDLLRVHAYARKVWPNTVPFFVGLGDGGATVALALACGSPSEWIREQRVLLELDFDPSSIASVDDSRFVPGLERIGGVFGALALLGPCFSLYVVSEKPMPIEVRASFSSEIEINAILADFEGKNAFEQAFLLFRRGW
jgi:hypothetical protein